MAIKAVIFDMDGTLINTTHAITDSLRVAFEYYGIIPLLPFVEFKNLMGRSMDDTLALLLPAEQTHYRDRIKVFYVDYYYKNYMDNATPYDGVAELLANLKNRKMKLAVITMKHTCCAERELKSCGLYGYFDYVTGTDEGVPAKPDPFLLRHTCGIFGVSSDEVVVIGDTPKDIEFGKNFGARTIAVTYGVSDRERFTVEGRKQNSPDRFAARAADILGCLADSD